MSEKSYSEQFEQTQTWKFHGLPAKPRLNELLGGGFAQNAYHLVYAGTGVGKTSFLSDISANWLMHTDKKICIISLEESMAEIQARIASNIISKTSYPYSYTEILKTKPALVVKEIKPFWDLWEQTGRLALVNATNTADVGSLPVILAEIGKRIYDFDIFIIDHIHLIYDDKIFNENVLTNQISKELKILANQGATIIGACQMRKNSDSNKEPVDTGLRGMESIKGSGQLGYGASSILHLYHTKGQREAHSHLSTMGKFEEYECMLRLEKSRYGMMGYVNFTNDPRYCLFEEQEYDRKRIEALHKD